MVRKISGPVRLGAIVGVDFSAPDAVSHVWPVALVETRSALEHLLVNFENELFFTGVYREGTSGNGEQLIAQAQESAERKNRISDAAGTEVDHEFLDVADLFALKISDVVAR